MGYLSGSSPHIKSGAVSALSVLVYQDTNICLSVSDLVPSLLSLLETKAVEVIKVSVLLLWNFESRIPIEHLFIITMNSLASMTGCIGLCKSDGVFLASKRPAGLSLRCCCKSHSLVNCL